MEFRDLDGVITVHPGADNEYRAAASLDNYRQLYQVYRGDRGLQRVHERFPMLCVWDDHEFSDDCWGANGTFFDGEVDELDVPRRKAANQAWFEYMPVDYADDPTFRYDPSATYPEDLRIYRDVAWGDHAHLVLTDLRSYRTDHLVPEDAFPGHVCMTEEQLVGALGAVPDSAPYYVDIATFEGGAYVDILRRRGGFVNARRVGGLVSFAVGRRLDADGLVARERLLRVAQVNGGIVGLAVVLLGFERDRLIAIGTPRDVGRSCQRRVGIVVRRARRLGDGGLFAAGCVLRAAARRLLVVVWEVQCGVVWRDPWCGGFGRSSVWRLTDRRARTRRRGLFADDVRLRLFFLQPKFHRRLDRLQAAQQHVGVGGAVGGTL